MAVSISSAATRPEGAPLTGPSWRATRPEADEAPRTVQLVFLFSSSLLLAGAESLLSTQARRCWISHISPGDSPAAMAIARTPRLSLQVRRQSLAASWCCRLDRASRPLPVARRAVPGRPPAAAACCERGGAQRSRLDREVLNDYSATPWVTRVIMFGRRGAGGLRRPQSPPGPCRRCGKSPGSCRDGR
jgi:hypothetical protein